MATAEKLPTFGTRKKKKVAKAVQGAIKDQEELNDLKEKAASQLPVPKGYKILVALPPAQDKSEGGIALAAVTQDSERVNSIIGYVLSLGPDAYADKTRFSEPSCKEGDIIIMRAYSGTRITIHGEEFRLINDDSVEATVEDPTGILKR